MKGLRTQLILVVAMVVAVVGSILSASVVQTAYAAVYRDISEFRHVRLTNATTISGTQNYNLTAVELQANDFFPVSTTAPGGATLDIDIADDAAVSASDVGSEWTFMIVTGSSAMTVTAGASGFTTVATINASGTTCEDAGDFIRCTASSTSKVTCLTVCAD